MIRVLERFLVKKLKRKSLIDFLCLRQRYNNQISKPDRDILRSWIRDFRSRGIPYFITSGPLKASKVGDIYTILWKAGSIVAAPIRTTQKITEGDSYDKWLEKRQKDLELYSKGRVCQCRNGCDHHGWEVCGLPVRPGNRFLCDLCAKAQGEIEDSISLPLDIYEDFSYAEETLDKQKNRIYK